MLTVNVDLVAAAGARSMLYSSLSQAFILPNELQFTILNSEEFSLSVESALAKLPSVVDGLSLLDQWEMIRKSLMLFDATAYEAEFLRLFEVGIPKAPCPLYESAYGAGDNRREIMGELVRFYNHFGLTLGLKAKEMPDHLHVELEFIHYMAFLEAQALGEEKPIAGLRQAQFDFHDRHLAAWIPDLVTRLDTLGSEVFSMWAYFAQALIQSDQTYLKEML